MENKKITYDEVIRRVDIPLCGTPHPDYEYFVIKIKPASDPKIFRNKAEEL